MNRVDAGLRLVTQHLKAHARVENHRKGASVVELDIVEAGMSRRRWPVEAPCSVPTLATDIS